MKAGSTAPLARALLVVCVVAACHSGNGEEQDGDRAYRAGRYTEALAAYREAVKADPAARVWAKVGAAALRADDLTGAADAYLRLAGEDPTRQDEAGEGLELTARLAERARNIPALHAAVSGLQAVAPERVAGQFTLTLARQPKIDPADLVALLPGAIAAAADPHTVDSMLAIYGAGLKETARCSDAIPVFRAVLRRSRDQGLIDAAGAAIVACTDTTADTTGASPAGRDSTADSTGVT